MFDRYVNNIHNSFLTNSFYLYLSYFSDYLLALFFLPFIATRLGTTNFGQIALAQAFGVFMVLFFEFGSSVMATREVSIIKENKISLKFFISKILTFKILLLPVGIIISLFSIIFVPVFSFNPFYVLIVMVGAFFQGVSPVWFFLGIEKMKKVAISKMIFRLFGFILILFFVKNPGDGWIVLASYSLMSALISLYLIYKMIIKIGFFNLATPIQSFEIYYKSKFSFILTIIPIINQTLTTIILSIYISPVQLGLYLGANRIYRAFNSLFGPLSQSFFPKLSSNIHQSNFSSLKLIKNYLLLMLAIGLTLLLIIFFFSEHIILLFLGKDYLSSNIILKIFGIVIPLTAISNVFGRQWLLAIKKDYFYTITQLISSLVSFTFFIFSLSKIGIISAPISLIVFEITSILMIVFYWCFKNAF